MKVFKRSLIVTFFLSLLVISISIGVKLRERGENVEIYPERADVSIGTISYKEIRDDRVEWELEADKAEYFRGSDLTIFSNVKLVFYDREGEVYTVRGRKGRYERKTGTMHLSGDVVGSTNSGYNIRTDSLTYRAEGRKILTDDMVIITGREFKIEGTGMLADIERNSFSLKNKVSASFQPQSNMNKEKGIF